MKLVELKCPKCGSVLQINAELTRGLCNYCGNEFLVEDEVNKIKIVNGKEFGYEQWQGAQDAINDQKQELMKKLECVVGPASNVEKLRMQYENRCNIYNSWIPIQESSPIMQIGIGFLVSIIIVLLSGIKGKSAMVLWIVVWWVLSGILIFRSCNAYYQKVKEKEEYKKQTDDIKEKYDAELKALMNKLDFIPQDYRDAKAVESIYSYLRNNRANDMTQAINLYEEEKHRRRLESLQR